MSEKKTIKKSVRAVWDELKQLRADRAKLYEPGEINASAELLTARAGELRDLAKQLSALSAMPATEKTTAAPGKRKQKKAAANDAE